MSANTVTVTIDDSPTSLDVTVREAVTATVDVTGVAWPIPEGGGGLALGETSTTAYRGDRGKTAYDHSQVVTGNPHGTTAADVGAIASGATAGGDLTGTYPNPTLNIDGKTGKTTPVDADELLLADSAATFATKKLTWANLKATAKTYFDTLYAAASHNHAASAITSGTVDTARLGAGTANSGTYLRGDQTWAAVSGSEWALIGSQHDVTPTEATVSWSTLGSYVELLLVWYGVRSSTSTSPTSTTMLATVSGSSTTYESTLWVATTVGGTPGTGVAGASSSWTIAAVPTSDAGTPQRGAYGEVRIDNAGTRTRHFWAHGSYDRCNSGASSPFFAGGVWRTTSTITSLALTLGSGSFQAGSFRLYGRT